MSLGSRFAKRGKAAVIASLASTPREPLPFLYPQGLRSSSTTASPTIADQTESFLPTNPNTTSKSVNGVSNLHEQVVNPSARSGAEGGEPRKQDVAFAGPQRSTPEDKNAPTYTRKDKSQLMNGYGGASPPTSRIRQIIQHQHKSRIRLEHNREVRNEYQSRMRAKKSQIWEPNWREILEHLSSNTPKNERWLESALNISVPQSAAARLLHGIDDNLWDIASRYGCSVYLSDEDSIPEHRNFLLSGGATAISQTAADILQIAPRVKVKARTGADLAGIKTSTQQPRDGTARKTMSEKHRVIPMLRADKIPKPSEWTQQSFFDYVSLLTASNVPNHLHRLMYKKKRSHVSTVIEILRELFQEPECRASFTRAAFNMAIQYAVNANQILDARMFFVHMEMMNIPMNDKTFNALLRGAAKNEDLQNFHFILHLMLRRGVQPNAGTWIAFLMAVPDLRIKLHIYDRMEEWGLFRHIGTVRDACEHIVSLEISASLDRAQSQGEFLQYMDSRYGPSWLTIDSSNRILHALAARGLISRCWDFLHTMDSRFIKPNAVSVNTVLNHCKQSGNLAGAVELMKSLPPSYQFVPDETTYHMLFEMAWRGKSYNFAKVVWRYACLNAATTRRMRSRMLTSLRQSGEKMHEPGPSPRQSFGGAAGLFISALKHISDHPTVVYRREFQMALGFEMRTTISDLRGLRFTPAEGGDSDSPDPRAPSALAEGAEPQIVHSPTLFRRYKLFLDQECEVFQTWQPVRPLADMLAQARAMDLHWMGAQDHQTSSFEWKLDHAIAIPIKAEVNCEPVEMMWK